MGYSLRKYAAALRRPTFFPAHGAIIQPSQSISLREVAQSVPLPVTILRQLPWPVPNVDPEQKFPLVFAPIDPQAPKSFAKSSHAISLGKVIQVGVTAIQDLIPKKYDNWDEVQQSKIWSNIIDGIFESIRNSAQSSNNVKPYFKGFDLNFPGSSDLDAAVIFFGSVLTQYEAEIPGTLKIGVENVVPYPVPDPVLVFDFLIKGTYTPPAVNITLTIKLLRIDHDPLLEALIGAVVTVLSGGLAAGAFAALATNIALGLVYNSPAHLTTARETLTSAFTGDDDNIAIGPVNVKTETTKSDSTLDKDDTVVLSATFEVN